MRIFYFLFTFLLLPLFSNADEDKIVGRFFCWELIDNKPKSSWISPYIKNDKLYIELESGNKVVLTKKMKKELLSLEHSYDSLYYRSLKGRYRRRMTFDRHVGNIYPLTIEKVKGKDYDKAEMKIQYRKNFSIQKMNNCSIGNMILFITEMVDNKKLITKDYILVIPDKFVDDFFSCIKKM